MFACDALLTWADKNPTIVVDLFDTARAVRLLRHGVAPTIRASRASPTTSGIGQTRIRFSATHFRYRHHAEDLRRHHHAVIRDRRARGPHDGHPRRGPGWPYAPPVVTWYDGHPDVDPGGPVRQARRRWAWATGPDIARMLVYLEQLEATDIPEHRPHRLRDRRADRR